MDASLKKGFKRMFFFVVPLVAWLFAAFGQESVNGRASLTSLGNFGVYLFFGWLFAILVWFSVWNYKVLLRMGMHSPRVTLAMWRATAALAESQYQAEKSETADIEAAIREANAKGLVVTCFNCGVVPAQLFVNVSGAFCVTCVNGPVSDEAVQVAWMTYGLLGGLDH